MADNFDANVARRKPRTKNTRPLHPWDVEAPPSKKEEPPVSQDVIEDIQHVFSPRAPEPSAPAPALPEKKKAPAKVIAPPSKEHRRMEAELSDTINIHSNFCKLHNDISDHLFRFLSPSAQSVYLRLYRLSFGWNRNWAAESLPKLSEACNLSLQTVRKAIKELEDRGCITRSPVDYHKATVYLVFLPSEIESVSHYMTHITKAYNRGLNIVTTDFQVSPSSPPSSSSPTPAVQNAATDTSGDVDLKIFEGDNVFTGGQEINIESVYFKNTRIYDILKTSGSLPRNIYKYMSNIQLLRATQIIDEFYESIGFSVVSRSQYRKSLIDFFEMLDSGFSNDDIRYAVRWTFKNSKTRPESFSLLKYTIHQAMETLIQELKEVSGEKDLAEEKKAALKKSQETEKKERSRSLTKKDIATFNSVVKSLGETVNENSFAAFIAPLKLLSAKGSTITLGAPPESVSWIEDHFADTIEEAYRDKTGRKITVEVR